METLPAIGLGVIIAYVIGRYFHKHGLGRKVFNMVKPLNAAQKAILINHFRFYGYLPPKSQRIFEKRVAKFMALKEFIPRNMSAVTEEMKVLISASAIQLTFGFPNVFLSYFKHIIVFPDQFYSNEGRNFHKGEVNPKVQAVVLSWKHFVEGYAGSEGINLGLHEMAHALRLENIVMNQEYNFLNPEAILQWQVLADQQMALVKSGETLFFRNYGSTDKEEFFAVAVELFFERPGDFMNYSSQLYKALANVLNQDPIRLYKKL
ncbi:MAG: zinc-dependent peptidase [Cyclobacteriaceae bacterium]